MKKIIFVVFATLFIVSCDEQIESEAELLTADWTEQENITLSDLYDNVFGSTADIQGNCYSCHSTDFPNGNFGYDDNKDAFYEATVNANSTQRFDESLIEPGEPEQSYLFRKLTGEDISGSMMPQSGSLNETVINAIRRWIEQGAQNN